MRIALCMSFSFFSLWLIPFGYPRGEPSSAPAEQKKTSITFRVDHRGNVYISDTTLSLFAFTQELQKAKSAQAKHATLHIDPAAPYKKIVVLSSILKGFGIKWTQHFVPFQATRSTSNALSKPSEPNSLPKQPLSPNPKTPQNETAIDWKNVPLREIPNLDNAPAIELRGQIYKDNGEQTGSVHAAIVQTNSGKRTPIGLNKTDKYGRFRFRFSSSSQKTLQLAILYQSSFLHYPIPLSKVQEGRLYLKILLPKQSTASVSKKPHHTVQKRLEHTTKQTPQVDQKRSTRTLLTHKQESSKWANVPIIAIPGNEHLQKVELRIQVKRQKQKPSSSVATGLIKMVNKKAIPLGRGKTDTNGRLRYRVHIEKNEKLKVLLLDGQQPYAHDVPLSKGLQKPIELNLKLPGTLLHLIVSPSSEERDTLRVTQYASLLGGQPSSHSTNHRLPISQGAKEIELGKNFTKKQMTFKKDYLALHFGLKPGLNQFAYSYLLPMKGGKSQILFRLKNSFERIVVFFHPSIAIAGHDKTYQSVPLSQGQNKKKEPFFMFHVPLSETKGELVLSFHDKLFQPGILGWLKKIKRKENGVKKLVGMGILFTTLLLGIATLFLGRPSKKETSPLPQDQSNSESS